jgi:hypothetical protein
MKRFLDRMEFTLAVVHRKVRQLEAVVIALVQLEPGQKHAKSRGLRDLIVPASHNTCSNARVTFHYLLLVLVLVLVLLLLQLDCSGVVVTIIITVQSQSLWLSTVKRSFSFTVFS